MKIFLFLGCFFTIGLTLFAQKPKKDFQIWGNFEIEAPINKRWMLHLQHQSRFAENATQYNYSYFDVGGLYRIGKNLRFTFKLYWKQFLPSCDSVLDDHF